MPTTTTNAAHLAWSSLNILNKERYEFLVKKFGSLEKAMQQVNTSLIQDLGCKPETVSRAVKQIQEFDYDKEQAILTNLNIQFFSIEDEEYPDSLRNLPDPPIFLFTKGNIDLLKANSIAIVGTRRMSAYGKRTIEHLVPELVSTGLVTVSGLALGIDAHVAKETIRAGGKTIAVLGHGIGDIYPRTNLQLADDIIANDGLIVTEYPLYIPPGKYTFPARNRIIAGLSKGTIVAEAASQSGSLITASLALEYGREVFAIPGQIFDKNMDGTHQLIAKGGAKLITSASDVLNELGVKSEKDETVYFYRAQTPDEQTLLESLTAMPQSMDDLVANSGLPTSKVNATLTLMELKGGVENLGMGMWVKKGV